MLIYFFEHGEFAVRCWRGGLTLDEDGFFKSPFEQGLKTRLFMVLDEDNSPPRVVQEGKMGFSHPIQDYNYPIKDPLPKFFIDLHGNLRRGSDLAIIFAAPDIINQES